jgi:cyclic nucleotide gated channel, plant
MSKSKFGVEKNEWGDQKMLSFKHFFRKQQIKRKKELLLDANREISFHHFSM